jgi:hypothetical protein
MLNAFHIAASPRTTSRATSRRGAKQEERLYKQVSRRVSLR